MYRKVNIISKTLIKGSYDVFKTFILFIAIVAFFFSNIPRDFSLRIIITNGVINYIFSLALIYVGYKKLNMKKLLKGIFPFLAVVISLLFAFYTNDYSITLKFLTFIYYIYMWKRGIDFTEEDKTPQMFTSELVLLYIEIFLIGFFVNVFGSRDLYLMLIKKYLLVFIVLSILQLMRLNLTTVYEGVNINTINKSKNILRFNILSIVIVSLILILVFTNYFGFGNLNYVIDLLKRIYQIFGKVIITVMYPLAWLLAKISKLLNLSFPEREDNSETEVEESKMQDMYDQEGSLNIEPILMVLKWSVFIIIGLVIIYIMYKKIRNIYISNKSTSSKDMEKEFVLSKRDIKKGIKKRFNQINNIISKYMEGNNLKNLPVIRRLYAEKVIKLNKQGYEYKKHYTPNEFKDYINSKKEEKSLELLTKYYNSARYGNKNITKKEIEEYIKLNRDN